jgi:hypothetical protein
VIKVKIFLDDYRYANSRIFGYNRIWAYSDCIALIDAFKDDLEFISLDYHLGLTQTGYDVLVYMHERNIHPKHINIHTDDKDSSMEMLEFAEKHFPNTAITQNKIPKDYTEP